MKFLFYTYSDTGVLTLDYDDGPKQTKSVMSVTHFDKRLKNAVKTTTLPINTSKLSNFIEGAKQWQKSKI